jgi:hypothetical protein
MPCSRFVGLVLLFGLSPWISLAVKLSTKRCNLVFEASDSFKHHPKSDTGVVHLDEIPTRHLEKIGQLHEARLPVPRAGEARQPGLALRASPLLPALNRT